MPTLPPTDDDDERHCPGSSALWSWSAAEEPFWIHWKCFMAGPEQLFSSGKGVGRHERAKRVGVLVGDSWARRQRAPSPLLPLPPAAARAPALQSHMTTGATQSYSATQSPSPWSYKKLGLGLCVCMCV